MAIMLKNCLSFNILLKLKLSYVASYLTVSSYTLIIMYNYYIIPRGEAIMLVKLSIILFSNSHNFAYYAHSFYLLFSKLCLV